jgi:uncharacterized protein YkwD
MTPITPVTSQAIRGLYTAAKRTILLLLLTLAIACDAQEAQTGLARDLLQQHNQLRAQGAVCGNRRMPQTHALTWSAELALQAKHHSQWLAEKKRLLHTNQQGHSLGTRLSDAGYAWREVAENLARTNQDSTAVIQLWLRSKNHCLNMFRPGVSEMGAAVVEGFWTAIYARPTRR